MFSSEELDLIRTANPAVISTIAPDGRAVTVPTWYLLTNSEEIALSIDGVNSCGDRLEHLRHEPRFTLTVMASDNWFRSVTVFAEVSEIYPDHDLQLVDRMARLHGQPRYPIRAPRTAIRARITDHIAMNRQWSKTERGASISELTS